MCNGTCTHALSRFPQRLFRQASGGGGALTDRCQHWVIDSADGYTIDIVPAHCAPVRRLAGDRSGRRTRTYLAFRHRRIGEQQQRKTVRSARYSDAQRNPCEIGIVGPDLREVGPEPLDQRRVGRPACQEQLTLRRLAWY